jgi:uncharacterized RDD family membrane protein YckC
MSEISILTAQNVSLRIELANIGDRFLASIIDFLIKFGITIGLSVLITAMHDSIAFICIAVAMLFATWVLYSLMFEFFMKGQTPGKRLMKIRVARLDGGPVTFGDLLLRWLLKLADFFFYMAPGVGVFIIILNEKHQRLGDMAASTIVVSTNERTSMSQTFYRETPADYVPLFPAADRLTPREAEILQEVFYQYRQNDKYSLITLAAAKVRELLQVNTDLDDLTFLKTVMKDYNFIASSEGKPFESRDSFSFSL